MNKAQLGAFLEKVKRGELADRCLKKAQNINYVAIAVSNEEIQIKNKSHLDVIIQILTEISEEGKQALEKARLE